MLPRSVCKGASYHPCRGRPVDSHERLQKKQISFGYKGHQKKRRGGWKNWRRKKARKLFSSTVVRERTWKSEHLFFVLKKREVSLGHSERKGEFGWNKQKQKERKRRALGGSLIFYKRGQKEKKKRKEEKKATLLFFFCFSLVQESGRVVLLGWQRRNNREEQREQRKE